MAEFRIRIPVSEGEVRRLRVGDVVYLDGLVHAWRDRAYDRALALLKGGGTLPENLQGCAHWHCGPITKKIRDKCVVVSAGATTSMRFDNLETVAIRDWGVKLVIGKGLGMGREVAETLKTCGAAYLSAVGGAASYYGRSVREVKAVYWSDLGMPEAMWVFAVKDFGPLEVSMDSHGGNLYEEVEKRVSENLLQMYRRWESESHGPRRV